MAFWFVSQSIYHNSALELPELNKMVQTGKENNEIPPLSIISDRSLIVEINTLIDKNPC